MHQDVRSSHYGGEGAPAWATCTARHSVVTYPGRWSNNYGDPAVDAAFGHFFANDVVGGLQQQFQRSWAAVPTRFATSPWVLGYDPINEPLALAWKSIGRHKYATGPSCLYSGSGGTVLVLGSHQPLPCPAGTPKSGVVAAIEASDPSHLVLPEVDNASDRNAPLALGTALDLPRVVYNFHDDCPQRSGLTGNPTDLQACSNHELLQIIQREHQRPLYANDDQLAVPAIMMTEFGATSVLQLARFLVLDAATVGLNWARWSWRLCNDPTGSTAEGLINSDGSVHLAMSPLTETYPKADAARRCLASPRRLTGNTRCPTSRAPRSPLRRPSSSRPRRTRSATAPMSSAPR